MTREITGLNEIEGAFDAVIADQYGVLHDGRMAFPGALDALYQLKARNVPVVALTNSGKRAKTNQHRLARLGFPNDLFRCVISSGEIARDRIEGLRAGSAVLLVAKQNERELTDGLDIREVQIGEPADLVVIAAVEPSKRARSDYADDLLPYAREKILALVVNPDHLSVENGKAVYGPGAVAEDYAHFGGPVEILGKPALQMFNTSLQALGNPSPSRVLVIGDSPHHDIAGAKIAGMTTLLIRDGIQSGLDGVIPDFAMEHLVWA